MVYISVCTNIYGIFKLYDDVITKKLFPYCWCFVRGNYRSSLDFTYKSPIMWNIDIVMGVYRIRAQSFNTKLIGCIPNYPLIREIIWYLELTDQYEGEVDRIYCCHVTIPLPSLHQSICLDYLFYHRLIFGENFMTLDTCLQDNGFHNTVFELHSGTRHKPCRCCPNIKMKAQSLPVDGRIASTTTVLTVWHKSSFVFYTEGFELL